MKVIRSTGKNSKVYHRPYVPQADMPSCGQRNRGDIDWLLVELEKIEATYRPCSDCF